jgi:hypothetical protein
VELCQRHGRAVADEVKRLLAGPFTPVSGTIAARMTSLNIPYAEVPPIEKLREQAKKSYAAERLVKRLEQGQKPPTAEHYLIATWTFGDDLAMVFLSNEVVVDYAKRLKRELDAGRLWINAYSNDVSAYIVSDRLIGEGGYEVNNSMTNSVTYGHPEQLQPSMENRIIEALRKLLPSGFQSPREKP